MRLTGKFLLAFTLVIVVVMGLQAQARLVRELDFFERDMRSDAAFAGELLGRAIARRWARDGEDAGREIIQRADLSSHHIHLRWTWLDDPALKQRLTGADRAALLRGESVAERVEHPADGVAALYTYVPVTTPGSRRGALELAESLDELHAYLARTKHDVIQQAVALLLGLTAAGALLGFLFIGRPMHLLAAKTQRIGLGDLTRPLVLNQRDELGVLAREINAMCERLLAAYATEEAEIAARFRAVEQLRHADRLATVGKLAAGVAHELGTPLNVVSGRAQLIETSEPLRADTLEHATIILDQTKRMTNIIRQLLDFARRETVAKARVDLATIADRSISMLQAMATKACVSLPPCSVIVHGLVVANEGQLQQVFTNLVVNAIQATPPGGTVRLEVGEEEATPPADRSGNPDTYAFLRVIDTGSGMDGPTAARIFEPFFTTKGVGEGTGLGLAVTHGIVAEHGGWIDVESRFGDGSRFTIRLPRASAGATS